MGKYTVISDKFKLRFEIDDLNVIPRSVNSLNSRLLTSESYLTLSDFINELGLPVKYCNLRYDEYG